MKITKSHLRKLIKEEISRLKEWEVEIDDNNDERITYAPGELLQIDADEYMTADLTKLNSEDEYKNTRRAGQVKMLVRVLQVADIDWEEND